MAEKELATEDDLDQNAVAEEQQEQPSSNKRKGLIAVIMLVVALLGTSFGLYMSGGANVIFGMVGLIEAESSPDAETSVERSFDGSTYKLDDIIVNISGRTDSGRKINRFLKIGISLIHEPAHERRITNREAYLRDNYYSYLRHLRQDEVEGTLGLMKLKHDLRHRANVILGEDTVKEVLITELLVQ